MSKSNEEDKKKTKKKQIKWNKKRYYVIITDPKRKDYFESIHKKNLDELET